MNRENKKTLRGSVLFTVVCVMALMIIFLTGTLALASASSNRAHKSYSTSQASYTARAAINSFIKAMERDKGVAAAVQDIGLNGNGNLTPDVIINDSTLGVIGYYDDTNTWHANQIKIETIPEETEEYVFTNKNKWEKFTKVKITATCRVGREEETVTATISKKPYDYKAPTGSSIEGLQEVGSNSFPNGGHVTGGLGVGISEDGRGQYALTNAMNVETNLTFINGSLSASTSTLNFHVRSNPNEPGDRRPYSETVILGNLWMQNNSLVNVDYKMLADYTQKEIPYLYIDGALVFESGVSLVKRSNNTVSDGNENSPFNIFIGTLNTNINNNPREVNFGGSDLYLMDTYQPGEYYDVKKIRVDNVWNGVANTNVERVDMTATVEKGANYLGGSGTSNLFRWASSFNNIDNNYISQGGNVYSKGNLTLKQIKISGNVCVEGDCVLGQDVTIGGDLIVKGKLTVENNADINRISGTIYCNPSNVAGKDIGAGSVSNNFTYHENVMDTGCVEILNAIYMNTPVEGEEQKYYVTDAMGLDKTDAITDSPKTIYKVDPTKQDIEDKTGRLLMDGDNYCTTDDDYSYYRLNSDGITYTEIRKEDAYVSYYTKDGDDKHYTAEEVAQENNSGLSGKVGNSQGKVAYPPTMTREAIFGSYNGEGFVEPNPATKIIRNIYDVRKSLDMDEAGDYDEAVYHTEVPGNPTLPYAFKEDGSKNNEVWKDNKIIKSCIIGSPNKNKKFTPKGDIIIEPDSSEMWVVLQDLLLKEEANYSKEIVCNTDNGAKKVNFLIRGELTLNKAVIIPNNINKECTLERTTPLGIEFYGAADSKIVCVNDSTIAGIFKCPETTFSNNVRGKITCTYTDKYGRTANYSPVIIGNALFKKVENAQNDFRLLISGVEDGVGGPSSVAVTELGTFEVSYFMGS